MLKHKLITLVAAGLLALGLPNRAGAQTFGEITGTVTDASGAVVPGATITLLNISSQQTRTTESNTSGAYTLSFVVPGTYDVSTASPGFKTSTRTGVEIQVGVVSRVNFSLEIGEVTETIEVTGGAPLMDTETVAVGTVIEERRIVELPLNGRNYLQLVALTPHVNAEMGTGGQAAGRQGGERANQPISVAGMRLESNHYTLDGVENTDVNFNTFAVRPSIEMLQEFKVQSGVYSAEFGRNASQINATTSPGGSAYHGTVFEFLRNDDLDATEFNAPEKNPFVRNQFGFVFGGPLIKNRIFFNSNFEALRDRKAFLRTASVPPDRMRAGDFSQSGRQIFDPDSRVFDTTPEGLERAVSADRFPNDTIPAARFNPQTQQLLEFLPTATVPGDNIAPFNFTRGAGRPISTDQFHQRIDFRESDSSQWFGRFSYNDDFVGGTETFADQVSRIETRAWQGMISNTRVITPTFLNEFRFGYTQFQNDNVLRFSNERDVTAELGIVGLESPAAVAFGTPSIGLDNGLAGFGEATGGPFVVRSNTFQWFDNMSYITGKHSFKWGVEIRREQFNQIGNQFARGSFIFQDNFATADPANRSTTGHSFGDFLLGESRRSERALGLAITQFRRTSVALYITDSWKIKPNVTIDIGLRWERTPPFHDKHRGIINAQLFGTGVTPGADPELLPAGTVRTPILTRPGQRGGLTTNDFNEGLAFRFTDSIPTQSGDQFLGRALVAKDNDDFAPRVGVSWSVTPKWTVRTGFGIFFNQDTGNPIFDMGRNLAGRGRFESNTERPNSNVSDPFAFQTAEFQCSGFDGTCQGPPFVLANQVFRRTPHVFQWMANVQRQLTDDTVLEVSYQGNAGSKLQRMRAFNDAVFRTGPGDTRTIEERRPFGDAFGIIQVPDGVGHSSYHSLGLKLQRRFSQGLTYLAAYTWSHAIDNGSGIRTRTGDPLFPQNSHDLNEGEKGDSQFDIRNRFVSSILYELPIGRGAGKFNKYVLGGWQVGTIITLADGTPLSVGAIGDRANIGEDIRPDATGIDPIPDNRTPDNFFNRAAFDNENADLQFRPGTAGRSTLLTPGLANVDFSAMKRTPMPWEGHFLEFRFEAFNFFNRTNFNAPSTDTRSPTFGIIQTARTPRELQFGLKYHF